VGFNSWNQLGCNYDEVKIRAVADSMISSGLRAAGYRYLVLDDCWMDRARNTSNCPAGTPAPCWQFDKQRFPSGGKALIDYVHTRGLLFGLYSSAGPKTCQGLPASLGREAADAQWLAAMEVDYFKYDNCGSEGVTEAEQEDRVRKMSDAVLATGRPIFMSLCEWNGHTGNPFDWVRRLGNSWRTDGDINPHVRVCSALR
jgi:alpha-galactosidase